MLLLLAFFAVDSSGFALQSAAQLSRFIGTKRLLLSILWSI